VKHGDDEDRPGEDPQCRQVAEFELLGEEVAGRGAEGEGEEDRQPVERLAPAGDDGVDGERALAPVPGGEDRVAAGAELGDEDGLPIVVRRILITQK
jgi:hypothetical protein